MRKARLFVQAMLVVGYATVWTASALTMLFAWEAPQSVFGWAIIILNPLVLVAMAVSLAKYRQRQEING